ncbi:MAG TPA: DUF4010 domain-containing protein [Candidatus Methanoperedens sp.]|nr:DUF4010 domain-containing protein [Candidatus Methanoperedens sp.]
MEAAVDLGAVRDVATALLIGALVGIEREKHKVAGGNVGIAGVRTFTLIALVGAVAAALTRELNSPWVLVAALTLVAGILIAGYVELARVRPQEIGMTTEAAAMTVCLLGAMCVLGHPGLAAALGIVTAALLAYKQPLHGLVGLINHDELYAGLRLLIASFVVLPLLPRRTIDPWDALNPYSLWLLVVLICTLSLAGYVATRWLGRGRGTALTGVTGGFVSSTAVTLSFARRSREAGADADGDALACGILLSWAVMFVRVLIEVLVVHPGLVAQVAPAFAAMGAAAAAAAWWHYRCASSAAAAGGELVLHSPFSLTEAVKFALFFGLVLVVFKIVQGHYPEQGPLVVAGLAGLTDVDAVTLSMAKYALGGGSERVATAAIVIASLTNTLVKCALAAALGSAALRRRALAGTGVILAAGAGALLLG